MTAPVRTLVLWFPDWPITAFLLENPGITEDSPGAPIAVVRAGTIVACSPSARAEGVTRGIRVRDAQSRCPDLHLVKDDPQRDEREFLPVLEHIEGIAPGVHVVRGGLCALRIRGPARYYGGENDAARVLADGVFSLGFTDIRLGIGDGLFTAEHAARRASEPGAVVNVGAGASRDFLASLPISVIGDDALIGLLARLGVRTLGEFAALDANGIRSRLGPTGIRLHELAGGRDSDPVTPRIPPPDLSRAVDFEPALELADQVAFGVRQASDDVIDGLGARGLVCTELRVEIVDERGRRSDRVWLHPTFFGAAEVVDRVRWQLEALLTPARESDDDAYGGAVAHVRIAPESVDAATHHSPGLFGQGPGERVHHALSRVQAMLGHRGVVVPLARGGRWLSERATFTPWGDRADDRRDTDRPWPGSLPAPLPDTVYADPPTAEVTGSDGSHVDVDERGILSREPAVLSASGIEATIASWAGPWPIHEREWDSDRSREAHRIQLVDTMQRAWLVVLEGDRWWIEGRYE